MSTNNNDDLESNVYNKKINDFLNEIPGRLYIFEITKFCGYSTLIFMYKDETMIDLWNRVSHHFDCHNIKGLYIDSHLNNVNKANNENNTICNDNTKCSCCSDKTGKYIPVPISSLKKVREFVYENIASDTRNLEPIYQLPLPVVYRIYLDDGHCHGLQ